VFYSSIPLVITCLLYTSREILRKNSLIFSHHLL
ncbi:hypothetical protein A5875_003109, partial [Enterococcus sp. 3H8_DIV0648]